MSSEWTEQASCIFSYSAQFCGLKEKANQNDGLHAATNRKQTQFWSLYTDQISSCRKSFQKTYNNNKTPQNNEIIQVCF